MEIQTPSHLDPSTIELAAIGGVGHTTQIIATMIYTKLGQNDEDGLEWGWTKGFYLYEVDEAQNILQGENPI